MIYLGLDYGTRTLGLSISDRSGLIATPLKVIRYENIDNLITELNDVIIERKVEALVLGNPLNLDGSISKRSEATFEFKSILEDKFSIPVYMQDERLSTVEAQNILISNNTRRDKRKQVVDKMASCIILQSYLDRINNGR